MISNSLKSKLKMSILFKFASIVLSILASSAYIERFLAGAVRNDIKMGGRPTTFSLNCFITWHKTTLI